jgi:hypothetical protein
VKNKILLVRRQITRGKKGKPKTRKKRAVDVSAALLAELLELKKTRKAEYLARGQNEIPDFIFLAPGQISGRMARRSATMNETMSTWIIGETECFGRHAIKRRFGADGFTIPATPSPVCY